MKKNYLLVCLLLFASVSFSQSISPSPFNDKEPQDLKLEIDNNGPQLYDVERGFVKPSSINNKAFGDTLAYEEFDSLDNTANTIGKYKWTVWDGDNNGNVWEWNTNYRTGLGTGVFSAIQSTTGGNGFISLPSDFYNSPRPTPLTEMNTWITSGPIALSKSAGSVYLSFQQYFARCCFFAPMYFLEVSTDSVTWVNIPGIEGTTPLSTANLPAAGIVPENFNISAAAANADTIYVRFKGERNWLWFWMIDDVTVLEGPKHDITLRDPRLLFNTDSFAIRPSYRQIPYDLFSPMYMAATITNDGSEIAKNTSLETSVIQIREWDVTNAELSQTVINRTITAQSESVADLSSFPNGDTAVVEQQPFSPLVNGAFWATFAADTDSTDQIPGSENDTLIVITTDSVYARDDGGFSVSNGIGPVSISRGPSVGGYDGDACGTMYILESRTQGDKVYPTSISFYVTTDPANIDISISPSIWFFEEDTASIIDAWLPEDFNNTSGKGLVQFGNVYKVTASDTNSWLTLPLDTSASTGFFSGLDSGQYIVGWEVISGSTIARDKYFEVGNDLSTAARQPTFTSLMYHANTVPKEIIWSSATTQFQPAIRLNLNTIPIQTSVEDLTNSKSQMFEVSPNPTNGELKINLMVEQQAAYNLNVRNVLGQVVYSDIINVNGQLTERLDLSDLDKGLYFVTLENAVERLQKKVILQ